MSSDTSEPVRLSRASVLAAAMDALDEDGSSGLTMRKLADRLDVVPMALYRHVKNKEDLLDGILDLAVRQVRLPAPDLPWREAMRALAVAIRAAMIEHPAVARLVVDRPNLGPAALDIGEYGFGVLRSAGFGLEHTERSLNLLLSFTLGFAALEGPRLRDQGNLPTAYDELAADRYPHTVEVQPDSASNFVGDEQFAFALERLLDGLEPLRAGREGKAAG